MITSDHLLNKSLFELELAHHNDDFNYYPFAHNQEQMGPWNSTMPVYHSIQISTSAAKDGKTKLGKNGQLRSKSKRRYGNKKLLQTPLQFSQLDYDKPRNLNSKTLQLTNFQLSPTTSFLQRLNSNNSTMLRRLSHLPVISAREQYGDIFKYTKPHPAQRQKINEGITQSLPKSNRISKLQQQLTFASRRIRKMSQKQKTYNNERQKIIPPSSSTDKVCRNPQFLPSIDRFLNRNISYDIYQRCVTKKQRNLKQREKQREKQRFANYKFV